MTENDLKTVAGSELEHWADQRSPELLALGGFSPNISPQKCA